MTTQSSPRPARLAGVLGGLTCGAIAAVAAIYLAANQIQIGGASPRVIFRPILWFLLAGGVAGYGIERWALAQPVVGRIVLIVFVIASPIVIYRLMLLYGLVIALGVVVVLAVVISVVMLFTKKS